MIEFFSSDTEVLGLAEPFSISFLRLSTSILVKKTEMNQNVTFIGHNWGGA